MLKFCNIYNATIKLLLLNMKRGNKHHKKYIKSILWAEQKCLYITTIHSNKE